MRPDRLAIAMALMLGIAGVVVAQVTVNAGTRLMVGTETALDTGKTKEGSRFTGLLEGALVVGDRTVAPAGAKVYGKVMAVKKAKRGRAKKKQARLAIQLTDIMIDGQMQPIISDELVFDTERPQTLKNVGKSAAIGALIDGKDGAKQSAAIRGSIEMLKKGKQISLDVGSLLEFKLAQPLTVQ